MDIVTTYIELLNRRAYAELEQEASRHFSQANDPPSALMIVHSFVRRGLFGRALSATHDWESVVTPEAKKSVRAIGAMCAREEELIAIENDAAERERIFDMCFWNRKPVDRAVSGRVIEHGKQQWDFADVADVDETITRRLVVFDTTKISFIPFGVMTQFSFSDVKKAIHFDDIWIPVTVFLLPRQGFPMVTGRVPAFYTGSLAHEDPNVSSGAQTLMNQSGLAPLGQRDYRFATDSGQSLLGIHQIRGITFDCA
jgi:hypothetical protein